jgi:hypothetical protein
MGSEIFVLFFPITIGLIPIAFVWSLVSIYKKRQKSESFKRYLLLFILSSFGLISALLNGNIIRGLLEWGSLLFVLLVILGIPVSLVYLAIKLNKKLFNE